MGSEGQAKYKLPTLTVNIVFSSLVDSILKYFFGASLSLSYLFSQVLKMQFLFFIFRLKLCEP